MYRKEVYMYEILSRLIGFAFGSCHRTAHSGVSMARGSDPPNYGYAALASIMIFIVARVEEKRRWKEMFVEATRKS